MEDPESKEEVIGLLQELEVELGNFVMSKIDQWIARLDKLQQQIESEE